MNLSDGDDSDRPGPSRIVPRTADLTSIPEPAAQNIFFYLRYNELKSVQAAVPSDRFADLVDYAEILLENHIRKCSNFIWHRSFDQQKEEDRMAPRVSHSMAYHVVDGAMYIFGGKSIPNRGNNKDPYNEDDSHDDTNCACFNDLWKLDMTTLSLSRIFVNTTPYPLPKCGASMVVYKDELLLFGGRRPVYSGHMSMGTEPNTNEIHMFNTETNSWRKIVPINDGPSLFGHSAVVCDDLFIAYGGTMDNFTLNTTFRVLDLKNLRWFTPRLPGVPTEFVIHRAERVATEFPIYGAESTSLIKLKPGHLLLLGEGRPPSRQNVGVVISYDISDPERQSWSWKLVPASGKWFECQKRQVGPSKHRNSNFSKVVAIEREDFVRLVTVGLPSSYFLRDRPRVEDIILTGLNPSDVETFVDGRCHLPAYFALAVIRDIQFQIDALVRSTIDSATILPPKQNDYSFSLQGAHVKVANFYVVFENAIRELYPSGTMKVSIWIDRTGEHFLGELDCNWLAAIVRKTVDHYAGYFEKESKAARSKASSSRTRNHSQQFPPTVRRLPPPPVDILKQQPHLVSYSALISLEGDWTPDKLTEIKYEEGESHYHCPPTFHDFAMCAGSAEVVMHGGDLSQHRMPHVTYLMIPSSRNRRPRPSTSRQ